MIHLKRLKEKLQKFICLSPNLNRSVKSKKYSGWEDGEMAQFIKVLLCKDEDGP